MTAAAGLASRLAGRSVVVPVTAQRRDLAERLRALGAEVLEVECIAIAPPTDLPRLRAAVERWCAGGYDWMAVTSRNAVAAMAELAREAGGDLGAVATPVATVGEATTRACAHAGLTVALTPEREDARGIVQAFPEGAGSVLAPVGNLASPVLARGIRAKGWEVEDVEAYRTIDGPGLTPAAREALVSGTADALLLTSTSVAERVRRDLEEASVSPRTAIVAIGATTAAGARGAGLRPGIVAARPSYDGILEALAAVLEEPR